MTEFEEDPIELAFVEAAKRIRREWEQSNPDEAHLGHAAVGFWQFFWLAFDQRSPLELIAARDSDALRKSANDYISSGFAEHRGPTFNEPAPDQIPAAFA